MSAPYYQDDLVTLYHGDCREITAWLEADVLVTDPPYGYSHRSGGGPRGKASWRNSSIANDADTSARDWVIDTWGERPALVFGSWKRPRPARARALLIWDKGGHAGMGDLSLPWKPNFEEIYVLGTGFLGSRDSGVLSGHHVPANETAGRVHPHEKPHSLMCSLITKCPRGVIADPFAGSGTTLRAAKDEGRKAIGVELDERYCEVIAKRLSQDTLFGGAA
jgi:DNA modification methylase